MANTCIMLPDIVYGVVFLLGLFVAVKILNKG
jgi:vacuolar-type H+-ATPase subunit I/STV1